LDFEGRQDFEMKIGKVEKVIGGRMLSIEAGRIARQASGAVVVRYADTTVFCAVAIAEAPEGTDFLPLTVDYREKTSAAGKFPGGFIKREGRPTTKEILTCRLIDRPLRPLFPENYRMETSVQSLVLSADQQNDPDILAMIAASAALAVSEVPYGGPTGSVRMGLVDGKLIINPTVSELQTSSLDLVVSGTRDAVTMVEAGAGEISEDQMIEAIRKAHEVIREIIEMQEDLARLCGKQKLVLAAPPDQSSLYEELKRKYYDQLPGALRTPGKQARKLAVSAVLDRALDEVSPPVEPPALPPPGVPDRAVVKQLLVKLSEEAEREMIVGGSRTDSRGYRDIREISIDVGLLPRVHGSALFTRGETQALVVVTLGTGDDEQIVDGLAEEYSEKFMLHYNFPSFCVGETWPNRGPKRREIGHGALAGRALKAVIPPEEKFPYTIRVIADIMESNGSSSMASVCGGTMALMDAGVKIRQPVAGIAMGLIKEGDKVCVLSDILGSEDHNGDMDFKVAGTQFGITALQMDIKISGVSFEIMRHALEQAKEGRLEILRKMLRTLERPRDEISPHAPKILLMTIDPEKIGIVIGPGGKMIKKIQDETGSKIEIEDDGTVKIWGSSLAGARGAQERIEALTEEVKPGRTYKGRVVSIKDFGCFVEVLPGQEGLVHVSELGQGYVQKVGDVVKIGDMITVKCLGIDNQGRIKLSKKAAEGDSRDGGGGERRPRQD
jgi:polyribonucleotide nucleotidyltransferase